MHQRVRSLLPALRPQPRGNVHDWTTADAPDRCFEAGRHGWLKSMGWQWATLMLMSAISATPPGSCSCHTSRSIWHPRNHTGCSNRAIKTLKIPWTVTKSPGNTSSAHACSTLNAKLGFRNVPVRDFDAADLQRKLPERVAVLDYMLKAEHTAYLHCTAGTGRSPSVAAAYLHWCLAWPLERALAHVRDCRNCSSNTQAIRCARWPIG